METTARQLAEAMAPSGWRLERAPKGPRKERWRWKMVHAATNSSYSCSLLGEVERTWRELLRVQQALEARAARLAGWHEHGPPAMQAWVRQWLQAPDNPMRPELMAELAAVEPGKAVHRWRQASSRMTVVPPPGHHDFPGLVRQKLAAVQQSSLRATLGKAAAIARRERL